MREVVAGLEGSRIREVANEGIGREGVLKFWFGESDEVTPEPIRQAAIASLQAGETFYAHNLGLPELREAIAGYTDRLHPGRGSAHWFGRLAVTCTRSTHGLLLVSRPGLDRLLNEAPARPGTPFGEPGNRTLPRQTHQRILATFTRGTLDVAAAVED